MKIFRLPPAVGIAARLGGHAAWQTGRLFRRLAARALDSVQDVLRAEVERGNLRLVADFLADKALPAARVVLLEQMSVRLLARLGLRGVLASNVVGWVLPFVIEGLIKASAKTGLTAKITANPTVANALEKLEDLRSATWKMLVPDPGSSAEVMDEAVEADPRPKGRRLLPPAPPSPA